MLWVVAEINHEKDALFSKKRTFSKDSFLTLVKPRLNDFTNNTHIPLHFP